jgi:uncharacterized protein with von Willebrand factor type A (vWA) domain
LAVCSYLKPDGTRCKAQPMREEQWCYVHHPDLADRRAAASRKGGHRGGRGRPLAELAEVKKRLRELADDVMAGCAARADAAVAGQLLGTYIRAVSVELKAREQLELIERLEALEAALEHSRSTLGYGA